jgi:hypothetical protein
MRRSLLTVVGIVALVLAAPSAALAHHGHHHHKGKAKAHHAKFRFVHIGANTASTVSTPSTGAGTTSPTTPTTPPPPENAGTVASYTNGVLTLTLNDGSTVSGKVTNDTKIECVKATPTPPAGTEEESTDQSQGDDNGQGDDQSRGDTGQQGDHESGDSGESQQDEQGDNGDDDAAPGVTEPPCDSSALVPKAIVRAAELRIGPGGTEFESILLVR